MGIRTIGTLRVPGPSTSHGGGKTRAKSDQGGQKVVTGRAVSAGHGTTWGGFPEHLRCMLGKLQHQPPENGDFLSRLAFCLLADDRAQAW